MEWANGWVGWVGGSTCALPPCRICPPHCPHWLGVGMKFRQQDRDGKFPQEAGRWWWPPCSPVLAAESLLDLRQPCGESRFQALVLVCDLQELRACLMLPRRHGELDRCGKHILTITRFSSFSTSPSCSSSSSSTSSPGITSSSL